MTKRIWTELSTDICRDSRLSRSALRVYISLTAYRTSDGYAYPSIKDLMIMTAMTHHNVSCALDELGELAWIFRNMKDDGTVEYQFMEEER